MLTPVIRAAEKRWKELHIRRWQRRIDSLIAMGLKIGKNVTIEGNAYIDQGSPFLIEIGDNSVLTNGCRVMSHDATPYHYVGGHTRLGRVRIKENVFIGENALILPGVTIGPNVLVAAGSVVNKDIPPNSCVAGIPARFYAKFDEMLRRHKDGIATRPVFDRESLYFGDPAEKERCKQACEDGDCYVQGFRGTNPFIVNPDRKTPPYLV